MKDKQNYFTYTDNTSDDNDKTMENLHKQTIIDGVDVSGCEHFNDSGNYNCRGCRWCKDNPNCYYKNWQRKEQECKSLRNLLAEHNDVMKINELMMKEFGIEILKDITTGDITLRSVKLIELKQECERLKEENAEIKKYQYEQDFLQQQLDQLKADNEELKEFQKLLEEQMKFNKSELELSLSSEIKRSEFLLKEFKKADKQRDNWREKAEKLKQTLAEIKEIAEANKKYIYVLPSYSVAGDSLEFSFEFIKQILQKISEVEDE